MYSQENCLTDESSEDFSFFSHYDASRVFHFVFKPITERPTHLKVYFFQREINCWIRFFEMVNSHAIKGFKNPPWWLLSGLFLSLYLGDIHYSCRICLLKNFSEFSITCILFLQFRTICHLTYFLYKNSCIRTSRLKPNN